MALVWSTIKSSIPASDKLDILLIQDEILGLGLKDIAEDQLRQSIPEEIQILVAQREKLRQQKKWSEADVIRQQINQKGHIIDDTPYGTQVKKKTI